MPFPGTTALMLPGILGQTQAAAPPSSKAEHSKEEKRLQAALKSVLSTGSHYWMKHLERIESSMRQTFHAVPKNANGRLGVRSALFILRRHLAREHGWQVKGLEPHGFRRSITKALHEANILTGKASNLAQAINAARSTSQGFSFGDIVAIYAAIERLILDEAQGLLEKAYSLNNRTLDSLISDKSMQEVLTSYTMMTLGGRANLHSNPKSHQEEKFSHSRRKRSGATGWKEMVTFQRDTWKNYVYAYKQSVNPFGARKYSFQVASRVAEDIAIRFGRWQDSECRAMKADLVKMDRNGLGRVPLGLFYKDPSQFRESPDYLRSIGALDDTLGDMPMVIIPNYVYAPCNCVGTFEYHTVCCMNECESLMTEIEGMVKASVATGQDLLSIVANNLSSASVDAPRHLPDALIDKMIDIEARHGGFVPIHGRLFQQWLHYAFPRECPYPKIVKTPAVLTREHYLQGTFIALTEDMERYSKASENNKNLRAPFMSQWTDIEVLPIHEQQDLKRVLRGSTASNFAIYFQVIFSSLICIITFVCFMLQICCKPQFSPSGRHATGSSLDRKREKAAARANKSS